MTLLLLSLSGLTSSPWQVPGTQRGSPRKAPLCVGGMAPREGKSNEVKAMGFFSQSVCVICSIGYKCVYLIVNEMYLIVNEVFQ